MHFFGAKAAHTLLVILTLGFLLFSAKSSMAKRCWHINRLQPEPVKSSFTPLNPNGILTLDISETFQCKRFLSKYFNIYVGNFFSFYVNNLKSYQYRWSSLFGVLLIMVLNNFVSNLWNSERKLYSNICDENLLIFFSFKPLYTFGEDFTFDQHITNLKNWARIAS